MNIKFNIGDSVEIQVGKRILNLQVLNVILRDEPHYYLDWNSAGYNHLLSTVAIPQRTIKKGNCDGC